MKLRDGGKTMKFNKLIKCSLAVALVFGAASVVTGCGNDNDSAKSNDKQYEIYLLAKEAGATDLTYEEWLVSIKGAKGDKGDAGHTPVITIGNNGNWYIDGDDSGFKATGSVGQTGADGTKWNVGTSAPTSNTAGNEGDFYFDSLAQKIYRKENNVWVLKTTINDGADGTDGKQIEFQTTGAYVQWRYVGETNWTNLIAYADINGQDGREIELRQGTTHIQWKYIDEEDTDWRNIVSLDDLKVEGEKGDPGKDGTKWLTGIGNPNNASPALVANEGDFYFDKVGNNIWTYFDGQWILDVDLEDDELPLTLESGKTYTGNIMERDFSIVLETVESVQKVKELYISGVVDGQQQPINCKDFVVEYKIENNVVILTIDTSHFTGQSGSTSIQYLVLDENDDSVFVTYVSEEDKEFLKGTYKNDNTYLTVGTSSILYYDGNARIRGTYKVIGHDKGNYTLSITTDAGKTLTAYADIYSRYYNFDIEDFSGVYSSNVGNFTYDKKTETITFEEEDSIDAVAFEYAENSSKAAIMFEYEEGYYCVYEVDYISGTVTDDTGVAGMIPFMGGAILYGENGPERFYVLNEKDKLQRVYGNTIVYSNEAVSVSLDLNQLTYRVFTNGNTTYSYVGDLEDLAMSEPDDGVITVVEGNTTIEFTFREDMKLTNLNIIGEELAVVNTETSFRRAIELGSEKISLADNIVLSSPINVTNDVVIEGNQYTISASSELEALIESDSSEVYTLFYIAEKVNVEFNNINLNGNQAGRAITAINGTVVFNDTHVTNGIKRGVYRSGGVFIGYNASFEMNSGSIVGNNGGVDGEITTDNYYLYYSSDLWIGANAVGSVVAIDGGQVGKVFVNANAYSANNPGSFTLSGGYIDSVYVEYDSGYGATFNYQENYNGESSVGKLYISTTTSGVAAEPIYNAQYGVYRGGEFAKDIWNGDSTSVPQAVNNVINITKASQLAAIAKDVNGGNTYTGVTIKLEADLDLNNYEWTPIGYGSSEANGVRNHGYRFEGAFDGQGHTISNLSIDEFVGGSSNSEAATGVGLFGATFNATIKNLKIKNASVTGNHFVAAVVGHARGTTIENVHVEDVAISCIYADPDESGDKAGAIVAFIGISPEKGSLVKGNTAKNSTINAARDAGQIIGCFAILDITNTGTTNRTVQEDNIAYSVVVTDNNETQNTDTSDNIKNEIFGRVVDFTSAN